jgi:hypothetical protein
MGRWSQYDGMRGMAGRPRGCRRLIKDRLDGKKEKKKSETL